MRDRHGPRAIFDDDLRARTRAISAAKSLAASASEMWITSLAIKRFYTAAGLNNAERCHHRPTESRELGPLSETVCENALLETTRF